MRYFQNWATLPTHSTWLPCSQDKLRGHPGSSQRLEEEGTATGSLDKSQGCRVPEMHSAVRVKETASFLPHNLVFQWTVTGVKKAGFLQCLFIYLLIFWGFWLPSMACGGGGLSSLTRYQMCTPPIGRQSFNHWATREVPAICHFWAKSLTPLHTFTQSTVLHGLIKAIINNFPKMGVFFNKEKSVLCILGNIMKNC